ncbi:hypothetical protein LCGC14_1990450 [marine sediment metagenome]|uniref:Uncharacterized protein n=1 Tax=marine sediment metagenome TaxID=412755 RepID=A0A0F9F632_9ZZZZ
MKWNMWAQNIDGMFLHAGEKRYVELFGMSNTIVPVIVEESDGGTYYGWLETDENEPRMICPSEVEVDMCFPYGYKIEEKKGRGRRIRLTVLCKEGNQ